MTQFEKLGEHILWLVELSKVVFFLQWRKANHLSLCASCWIIRSTDSFKNADSFIHKEIKCHYIVRRTAMFCLLKKKQLILKLLSIKFCFIELLYKSNIIIVLLFLIYRRAASWLIRHIQSYSDIQHICSTDVPFSNTHKHTHTNCIQFKLLFKRIAYWLKMNLFREQNCPINVILVLV